MQEQLTSSLRATYLAKPVLRTSSLVNINAIHKDIITALPHDPAVTNYLAVAIPENSRWSRDTDGLLWLDNRIYVPDANDLRLRMLRYKHDHPLSRHFGQNRTLDLVHREYTWLGMHTFVKDYMSSCTACACAKTPCHKPYGLLKQLLVPECPWHSISMDFIEHLPASSGFTAILVIIDWLLKQCIFVLAADTIMAPELAKLFLIVRDLLNRAICAIFWLPHTSKPSNTL
jgi:hypothetical protein